jgi:ankyrin repeat protein
MRKSASEAVAKLHSMPPEQPKPSFWKPATGSGGMSALHYAAYDGDLDAVVAALTEGSLVDARDDGNWTALHWVVDMGAGGGPRDKIIEALLDAGADIEARDLEGSTPIMVACRSGSGDLARQLARGGADIGTRNSKGWTTLMEAAGAGDTTMVIFLLERGVDSAVREQSERTALDIAIAQGFEDVVAILRAPPQRNPPACSREIPLPELRLLRKGFFVLVLVLLIVSCSNARTDLFAPKPLN